MTSDGFYSIVFQGATDWGVGTVVLSNGKVVGADVGGVTYDGTFKAGNTPGTLDIDVTANVPANVRVVQGYSKPTPWSFPIKATVPAGAVGQERRVSISTPLGTVALAFKMLRPM